MTDILNLANSLRSLDDLTLMRLASERSWRGGARTNDFFDLSELLLETPSIEAALQKLDRHTLAVIAAVGSTPTSAADLAIAVGSTDQRAITARIAHVAELGLVTASDEGYASLDTVTAALKNVLGDAIDDIPGFAAILPPASTRDASAPEAPLLQLAAAEQAYETISSTAELLIELLTHPARELGKGGLGLPERKRLGGALRVVPDAVQALLALAVDSGLASHERSGWLTAELGENWLTLTTAARWATLAGTWLDSVPPELRTALLATADGSWGSTLRDYAEWLYPAGSSTFDGELSRVKAQARLLGITSGPSESIQLTSAAGTLLLQGDGPAATTLMAEHLPRNVEQVYLQPDLTIIAPGPLAPEKDLRLRLLAELEARAQAYSYRLTAASINRALSSGETAETMLRFLGDLSLTGIPQPVEYLVSQAANSFGTIRVGTVPEGQSDGPNDPSKSYIRSSDTSLIRLLEVDQSLNSLALRRGGEHRLLSRFDYELVFWALSDARYPVAAETADGELVHVSRRRIAEPATVVRATDYGALVARLRDTEPSGAGNSDDAWIARQLDSAIRAKQTVVVTVEVPGQGPVEFTLEPTGVAGGRLRGRDRLADIERTLPLSSIVELK